MLYVYRCKKLHRADPCGFDRDQDDLAEASGFQSLPERTITCLADDFNQEPGTVTELNGSEGERPQHSNRCSSPHGAVPVKNFKARGR